MAKGNHKPNKPTAEQQMFGHGKFMNEAEMWWLMHPECHPRKDNCFHNRRPYQGTCLDPQRIRMEKLYEQCTKESAEGSADHVQADGSAAVDRGAAGED